MMIMTFFLDNDKRILNKVISLSVKDDMSILKIIIL